MTKNAAGSAQSMAASHESGSSRIEIAPGQISPGLSPAPLAGGNRASQIVLIQPRCGSWDEMSVRFPESLLAVAAVPVSKGYTVSIIDERLCKNTAAEIARVVGPETKIFGITAITGQQIKYALQATALLKSMFPRVPVCWGGVHATLLPEQTIAHPLIDYVVVGDGNYVLCELFERLNEGKPVDDLRGIVFKKPDGSVQSNAGVIAPSPDGRSFTRQKGSVDILRDLDSLPALPYQLLDIDKYSVFDTGDGKRSATLNTSRGCPYRCKFCSNPVINEGTWRGYSPQRIIEFIDRLRNNYGYQLIYFQDDYLPGSKGRFIELLNKLTGYKRQVLWSTLGIRADILSALSDEEWELLYASGCHSLEIGIESGNERIIRLVNKGETLAQMRLANQKLARFDIKIKYTLIIGFPGETEAEIMDTVAFAEELEKTNKNAYCIIFTFLPIIGTPYYEEAVRQGFVAPTTVEEWGNMDFDGWMKRYTNWTSSRLRKKLEAISFVSYFHNRNVAYKFGGSALLRLAFRLYYPIAQWRFKRRFFGLCIEIAMKDLFFSARDWLRGIIARKPAAAG
jgi:radical SAM superfamily enzyme YgiQ (UPF0313 family)